MSDMDKISETEEGDLISPADALTIGYKLIEMADRARKVDPAVPGVTSRWKFSMDDDDFIVTVKREVTQ